ncbi:hypothetical protein [Arthrobacter sp. S2(2024)]|uniref:hypothetical protein n=1 Tax=Arthrobacter sp. S2(2024) TaxID=3111911 RepID=UPI002FCC2C20
MEFVADWTTLKYQDIEVHIGGKLTDQGRVVDVMSDGSVLWLMHDGVSRRRLIENLPETDVMLGRKR